MDGWEPLKNPPPTDPHNQASRMFNCGQPKLERIGGSAVRITDPATGAQKEQKLAQLGAVDPKSLMAVAEVAGFGAQKYARYNFARGYKWSLSYDALQRHLNAWWGGEDNDPESGMPHVAHAAWHCLALLTFILRKRGTDDRFTLANITKTVADDATAESNFLDALEKLKIPYADRKASWPPIPDVTCKS